MEKIGGAALKKALEKQNSAYNMHSILSTKWWEKACHLCWLGSFVHFLKYVKIMKQTSSV